MSQNISSAQQDHMLSPHNDSPQPQLLPTQTSPDGTCLRTSAQHTQGNWIDKKTKEQSMVAATVIATMTFQSVISPPGGVWQEDTKHSVSFCNGSRSNKLKNRKQKLEKKRNGRERDNNNVYYAANFLYIIHTSFLHTYSQILSNNSAYV
ncbi:putative PGG domain-containing protein [Medicago truncatula]|uniref:Putative PGG domain-containing protein n=1 Tax=Medicago truncatula TaxID=3880 RepID=A0A396H6G0_MEDTR|nr:putative PGG domain-containing protein [Medicago truncatula]